MQLLGEDGSWRAAGFGEEGSWNEVGWQLLKDRPVLGEESSRSAFGTEPLVRFWAEPLAFWPVLGVAGAGWTGWWSGRT
jgi:hypothetical protein